MLVSAIGLPLINQGLYWGIRLTGRAHTHGYLIAAITVAAESLLVIWVCARTTHRRTWMSSITGMLLNIAVSALSIYFVTYIALAASYAGCGSD